MCLGIPGQVIEFDGEGLSRKAQVSFSGVIKPVAMAYVPEAEVGDYVIVHVGVAISKIDEAEAQRALVAFQEIEGSVERTLHPEEDKE